MMRAGENAKISVSGHSPQSPSAHRCSSNINDGDTPDTTEVANLPEIPRTQYVRMSQMQIPKNPETVSYMKQERQRNNFSTPKLHEYNKQFYNLIDDECANATFQPVINKISAEIGEIRESSRLMGLARSILKKNAALKMWYEMNPNNRTQLMFALNSSSVRAASKLDKSFSAANILVSAAASPRQSSSNKGGGFKFSNPANRNKVDNNNNNNNISVSELNETQINFVVKMAKILARGQKLSVTDALYLDSMDRFVGSRYTEMQKIISKQKMFAAKIHNDNLNTTAANVGFLVEVRKAAAIDTNFLGNTRERLPLSTTKPRSKSAGHRLTSPLALSVFSPEVQLNSIKTPLRQRLETFVKNIVIEDVEPLSPTPINIKAVGRIIDKALPQSAASYGNKNAHQHVLATSESPDAQSETLTNIKTPTSKNVGKNHADSSNNIGSEGCKSKSSSGNRVRRSIVTDIPNFHKKKPCNNKFELKIDVAKNSSVSSLRDKNAEKGEESILSPEVFLRMKSCNSILEAMNGIKIEPIECLAPSSSTASSAKKGF